MWKSNRNCKIRQCYYSSLLIEVSMPHLLCIKSMHILSICLRASMNSEIFMCNWNTTSIMKSVYLHAWITWQQLNTFRHLDVVKTTCTRMGKKKDLSDFERGMVVGARRSGLSISKTADLLEFSHTTISRVYWEWSEKEKISSERQLCGRKCLVDVRGEWNG